MGIENFRTLKVAGAILLSAFFTLTVLPGTCVGQEDQEKTAPKFKSPPELLRYRFDQTQQFLYKAEYTTTAYADRFPQRDTKKFIIGCAAEPIDKPSPTQSGLFQGVMVSNQGHFIFPAEHLIGAVEVAVGYQGKLYPFRIVRLDPANNLAILQIKTEEKTPAATLRFSDLDLAEQTLIRKRRLTGDPKRKVDLSYHKALVSGSTDAVPLESVPSYLQLDTPHDKELVSSLVHDDSSRFVGFVTQPIDIEDGDSYTSVTKASYARQAFKDLGIEQPDKIEKGYKTVLNLGITKSSQGLAGLRRYRVKMNVIEEAPQSSYAMRSGRSKNLLSQYIREVRAAVKLKECTFVISDRGEILEYESGSPMMIPFMKTAFENIIFPELPSSRERQWQTTSDIRVPFQESKSVFSFNYANNYIERANSHLIQKRLKQEIDDVLSRPRVSDGISDQFELREKMKRMRGSQQTKMMETLYTHRRILQGDKRFRYRILGFSDKETIKISSDANITAFDILTPAAGLKTIGNGTHIIGYDGFNVNADYKLSIAHPGKKLAKPLLTEGRHEFALSLKRIKLGKTDALSVCESYEIVNLAMFRYRVAQSDGSRRINLRAIASAEPNSNSRAFVCRWLMARLENISKPNIPYFARAIGKWADGKTVKILKDYADSGSLSTAKIAAIYGLFLCDHPDAFPALQSTRLNTFFYNVSGKLPEKMFIRLMQLDQQEVLSFLYTRFSASKYQNEVDYALTRLEEKNISEEELLKTKLLLACVKPDGRAKIKDEALAKELRESKGKISEAHFELKKKRRRESELRKHMEAKRKNDLATLGYLTRDYGRKKFAFANSHIEIAKFCDIATRYEIPADDPRVLKIRELVRDKIAKKHYLNLANTLELAICGYDDEITALVAENLPNVSPQSAIKVLQYLIVLNDGSLTESIMDGLKDPDLEMFKLGDGVHEHSYFSKDDVRQKIDKFLCDKLLGSDKPKIQVVGLILALQMIYNSNQTIDFERLNSDDRILEILNENPSDEFRETFNDYVEMNRQLGNITYRMLKYIRFRR